MVRRILHHRFEANDSRTCRDPFAAGFTLVELLAVLAVLALMVPALALGLNKQRPRGQSIQCLNNLRQFTVIWTLYSADNSGRVPNNFGVAETLNTISDGTLGNWANDVMSWDNNQLNTNLDVLTRGALGPYLNGNVSLYKCPADRYLSPAQSAAGWTQRSRSISMNSVFGRFSTSSSGDPTANGLNWAFPQYLQYLTQTAVPKPAKTWLLLDEQPDSINDGYFVNTPTVHNWQDIPAAFHNGSCGFSFSDGHAEMRLWLSQTSRYPVQYFYPAQRPFDAAGQADFAWYLERTGYVLASTGQGAFGY
jgi:prepilin-type N-terminal cleavage/methylation domain-containing protein/prepilin-type processing-associated H-X9-DG protein